MRANRLVKHFWQSPAYSWSAIPFLALCDSTLIVRESKHTRLLQQYEKQNERQLG